MVRPRRRSSIDCAELDAAYYDPIKHSSLPSGKSPLLPVCKCLPRYHPSPKSSSRSMSSILSPFVRLSSSELRASKSSELCISLALPRNAFPCNQTRDPLTDNQKDFSWQRLLRRSTQVSKCHYQVIVANPFNAAVNPQRIALKYTLVIITRLLALISDRAKHMVYGQRRH